MFIRALIRHQDGQITINPLKLQKKDNYAVPYSVVSEEATYQFVGMHKDGRTAVFVEKEKKVKIMQCQHHICDCLREEMMRVRDSNVNLQELCLSIIDSVREMVPEKVDQIMDSVIKNNVYAANAWKELQHNVKKEDNKA